MDETDPQGEVPSEPRPVSRRSLVKGLGAAAAAGAAGLLGETGTPRAAYAAESGNPQYRGSYSTNTWRDQQVQAFDGLTYDGTVYQARADTTSTPGGTEWAKVDGSVSSQRMNWTEWNQTFQANVFMHGPHPYIDVCAPPFSCVGDDKTDNTQGLQAAIDYCTSAVYDNVGGSRALSTGGRLFLGLGAFRIGGPLQWGGHDGANGYAVDLVGSGRYHSSLKQIGTGPAYHLLDATHATGNHYSSLRDLTLLGNFGTASPNATATLAEPLPEGDSISALHWSDATAAHLPELPVGTLVRIGTQSFTVAIPYGSSSVPARTNPTPIDTALVLPQAGQDTTAGIYTAGDGFHGAMDGWLLDDVSISGFRHGICNLGNYVHWIRGMELNASAGYGYWGHSCFDSRYSDWWLTGNKLGNIRMDNPSEMRLYGMELEQVEQGPMIQLNGGGGVSIHMVSLGNSHGPGIVVNGCGGVGIVDVDILGAGYKDGHQKPGPTQPGIHLMNAGGISISNLKLGGNSRFGDRGVVRIESDCNNVVVANSPIGRSTQWTSRYPIVDLASDTVITGVAHNESKAPLRFFGATATAGTSLAGTQAQVDLITRALEANGVLMAVPGVDPVGVAGVVMDVELRTDASTRDGMSDYPLGHDRTARGNNLTRGAGTGPVFHRAPAHPFSGQAPAAAGTGDQAWVEFPDQDESATFGVEFDRPLPRSSSWTIVTVCYLSNDTYNKPLWVARMSSGELSLANNGHFFLSGGDGFSGISAGSWSGSVITVTAEEGTISRIRVNGVTYRLTSPITVGGDLTGLDFFPRPHSHGGLASAVVADRALDFQAGSPGHQIERWLGFYAGIEVR